MKYVTMLTTLATLSLAACEGPEDVTAKVNAAPAPNQAVSLDTSEPESPARRARAAAEASPAVVTPARPVPPVDTPLSAQHGSRAVARSKPATVADQRDPAHGEQIYRQNCAFCHDKGITGAPVIGEAGAWSPRLAQGMDALYASALQGRNAMPARGGNPSLADGDVRAAVDYLAGRVR